MYDLCMIAMLPYPLSSGTFYVLTAVHICVGFNGTLAWMHKTGIQRASSWIFQASYPSVTALWLIFMHQFVPKIGA